MNIKKVTVYICPETGDEFNTKYDAEQSALKFIENKKLDELRNKQIKITEQQTLANRDWLRLNLENIKDIPNLLRKKTKEFCNINIEVNNFHVNFGNVSNSHCAPINKKTNWSGLDKNYPVSFPGWRSRIHIESKSSINTPDYADSISTYLFTGSKSKFAGFHATCGCPGSFAGTCHMDMDFFFFLEDFPNLIEQKNKYDNLIQLKKQCELDLIQYNESLTAFVNANPKIMFLKNEQCEIRNQMLNVTKKLELQYNRKNPIPTLTTYPDYDKLEESFGNIYK